LQIGKFINEYTVVITAIMNKFTVFIIKRDAIIRGISEAIRRDIEEFYEIIGERELIITREMVTQMREREWQESWHPYPDDRKKEFIYANNEGLSQVLLCKIKGENDAISFGKKLRGANAVGHLCDEGTLRRRYMDQSLLARIQHDEANICYLCNENGERIGFVPNAVHTVDNSRELDEHLEIFFRENK